MAISAKNTLVRATAALVLCGAAVAQAAVPEILEQPQSASRTEVVRMEWAGGGNDARVVVERRHVLDWVTEARPGSGRLLVGQEGTDGWVARWQPGYYTPSGTYRIRVEGEDYAFTSDKFDIRPCSCVVPNQVRARWRNGGYRLRVTAEYAARAARGFSALPTEVTTGRPLVRVMRDGRRIGSVRLRYREGKFRGVWRGPRGAEDALVFRLISLTDAFGNS